jgi:selenide,water dikinase
VGIIVTAYKADQAEAEHIAIATDWMKRLNRDAALALPSDRTHAVTDITGFGLLGHAWEVAQRSGVQLNIRFDDTTFHPGALRYADEMLFPGGANTNMSAYEAHVMFAERLPSNCACWPFARKPPAAYSSCCRPVRRILSCNAMRTWVIRPG